MENGYICNSVPILALVLSDGCLNSSDELIAAYRKPRQVLQEDCREEAAGQGQHSLYGDVLCVLGLYRIIVTLNSFRRARYLCIGGLEEPYSFGQDRAGAYTERWHQQE